MRSAGRIWVDVTGILPGSDAAVYSELLCAGFARIGEDAALCRREAGLRPFTWPDVAWCRELPPPAASFAAFSNRQRLADLVPTPTRRAIVRFVQSQRAVLAAWRRTRVILPLPSPAMSTVSDTVVPGSHDVLLMLGMSGDVSRFARSGTRLAVLLVDATPALRPDWFDASTRVAFDAWRCRTAPLLSIALAAGPVGVMALEGLGVTGVVQMVPSGASAPAMPLAPCHFVLAAGPIGVAGATSRLLLAWRRLMETTSNADVPLLVLAGPVGPLADDALAQLHNSAGLGGKVLVVPFPSASLLSALMRDCLFCIAPDVTAGWNRVESEAMAIGKACLSASRHDGELGFDAENPAALADLVRAWLAVPPMAEAVAARDWDEVARDVAQAVFA